MSELSPRPYILVGIDGSASALHALTWAVREAQMRNLPLKLVYAADYGGIGLGFNPGASESFFEFLDISGQRFLNQARHRVQALAPQVEVSLDKVAGRPTPVLIELSKQAFLTVLGSSGFGALAGVLAGSVAVALSARGHSPVTIVRAPGALDGPIVIGISGSPECEEAISWAFEEASLRGIDLVAILVAKLVPAFFYYSDPPWSDLTGVAGAEQLKMLLAERLAGWQEKFPDVTVHRINVTGNPGEVLLSHAQHAQMIVTGSHGHGDAVGFFLGSTSHRLLHRAACPVLIARPHARESTR